MVRIFEIVTETADDNQCWCHHNVAAPHADEAIRIVRKKMSKTLKERIQSIKLIASETED